MAQTQGPYSFPALTSQIASTADVYANKPEYLFDLMKPFGLQGLQFYNYFLATQAEVPVAQEEFFHFEEEVYSKTVTTTTIVAAPGAGQPITLTLSADDVTSDGYSYPRERFRLENLMNGAQYVVDTKSSASSLILEPILSTTNEAIASGDVFAVMDSLYGEGTGQPDTAFSFENRIEGTMQILKETISMTGTEKTNQKWFTKYDTGTEFEGYWTPMMMQAEYRLRLQEYTACWWAIPPTNTDVDADGMHGLINELSSDGEGRGYNLPTASLTIENLQTIALEEQSEYYYGPLYGWMSNTRYTEINADLSTEFQDNNNNRTQRELDSYFWDGLEGAQRETLAATLDFKSVTLAGRVFGFCLGFAFNDPGQGRLTNTRSQDYSVFAPMGGDSSPRNGYMKYLQLRYKQLGSYSRRSEVWRDGSAHDGLRLGEFDFDKMYWRCHIGLQTFKLNRFVLVTPEAAS